jgi:hypothetical protein
VFHQYALREIENERRRANALAAVRTQHPELDAMYQTGRTCEQALADVFPRRF